MESNKKTTILAVLTILQGSIVFANGAMDPEERPANVVGRIAIKDSLPQTAEDVALSSEGQKENLVGKIMVSEDLLYGIQKNRKKDSPEMIRVKSKLAETIEAVNSKDYDKAIAIMEHLHSEHPESSTLLKWLGVYKNMSGDYVGSAAAINQLYISFPLSSDEINNDFILSYYDIDNSRHLGIDVSTRIPELKTLSNKHSDIPLESTSRKTIYMTLCSFQDFMVHTKNGKEILDSKELDNLWKMIPANKKLHLDNFYGFDIDELSQIYGSYYNRKDVLGAYAERQVIKKKAITEEKPLPEKSPQAGSID